jgi:hypothetical protein
MQWMRPAHASPNRFGPGYSPQTGYKAWRVSADTAMHARRRESEREPGSSLPPTAPVSVSHRLSAIARLVDGPSEDSSQGSGGASQTRLRPVGPRSPLGQHPSALLLHGDSALVVDLLLYALARDANPAFLWLDVPNAVGKSAPREGPIAFGWVSDEQRVTVERLEMLLPGPPLSDASVSQLIRVDEPRPVLNWLLEFVQLPEACQRILASRPTGSGPGVVAVTNIQSVMAAYTSVHVGPIVSAHIHAGYSLAVGYAVEPDRSRHDFRSAFELNGDAFNYVLRVEGSGVRDWEAHRLVCEKGDGPAPFESGAECLLADLPFVSGVFRAAAERS